MNLFAQQTFQRSQVVYLVSPTCLKLAYDLAVTAMQVKINVSIEDLTIESEVPF